MNATKSDLSPLTNDEAALLYTVSMCGRQAYPISRLGSKWRIGPWRDWPGFPTAFGTKKAAVERFEQWRDLARERWASMRLSNPDAMLTAVGIR